MKKVTVTFTLLMTFIALQFVSAQQDLALVMLPSDKISVAESSVEEVRIDRSAISEISDYITTNIKFQYGDIGYANQEQIKVQIAINAFGELIDYRIVEGSELLSKKVLNTLSHIEKVSPILVNGVPTSKTIQIPLIFRQ